MSATSILMQMWEGVVCGADLLQRACQRHGLSGTLVPSDRIIVAEAAGTYADLSEGGDVKLPETAQECLEFFDNLGLIGESPILILAVKLVYDSLTNITGSIWAMLGEYGWLRRKDCAPLNAKMARNYSNNDLCYIDPPVEKPLEPFEASVVATIDSMIQAGIPKSKVWRYVAQKPKSRLSRATLRLLCSLEQTQRLMRDMAKQAWVSTVPEGFDFHVMVLATKDLLTPEQVRILLRRYSVSNSQYTSERVQTDPHDARSESSYGRVAPFSDPSQVEGTKHQHGPSCRLKSTVQASALTSRCRGAYLRMVRRRSVPAEHPTNGRRRLSITRNHSVKCGKGGAKRREKFSRKNKSTSMLPGSTTSIKKLTSARNSRAIVVKPIIIETAWSVDNNRPFSKQVVETPSDWDPGPV